LSLIRLLPGVAVVFFKLGLFYQMVNMSQGAEAITPILAYIASQISSPPFSSPPSLFLSIHLDICGDLFCDHI
jgi:hypothetical protein